MGKIKEILIRYKWIIIGGLSVAILAGIAMANIHIFQLINYKMQEDTTAIITLMEKEVTGDKKQDSWYFSEGMEYLLQDMSEETKAFLEEYFVEFDEAVQKNILATYNQRNLFFENPNTLTTIVLDRLEDNVFAGYLKRLDEVTVDKMLADYFGANITLDEAFVDKLYQITSVYPKQLILDKFKFDVYGLLVMDDGVPEEDTETQNAQNTDNAQVDTQASTSIETPEATQTPEATETSQVSTSTEETVSLLDKKNTIFSKLKADKARAMIFNKLKVSPIQVETLQGLMEFLNRNKILETKTYTSFNRLYGEIGVIRKQYSEIDDQEIDLNNKKQAIEVKISEPLKNIETKKVELKNAQAAVSEVESKLENLTGYAYMALYIEKAYGNGEYEASIPTTGLFGNFRPSSQKYIIRLTASQFSTPGVYYVNIKLQGTKTNSRGDELPYYVEVSNDQLSQIESLQAERTAKLGAVSHIEGEIATIEAKIAAIKEEGGYADIEAELKNLALQRETYVEKLNEKAVEIQNLLSIGKVIVELE